MSLVGLECLGGKINDPDLKDTAFVHRDAQWNFDIFCGWEVDDPKQRESTLAWANEFYQEMGPYLSGRVYQNYPNTEIDNWPDAYYGDKVDHLVGIKRKWDPENVFHRRQGFSELVN